jgi:hypothetical protein
MPATSKAQFGFMARVASGKQKVKGLSKKQAKEFLTGVNPNKLPARIKKKKLKVKKKNAKQKNPR